jgi:hypothetical protein
MAQSAGDRRRINGPEESFSPVFDDDDEDDIGLKTQRSRAPGDIRPICESFASVHFYPMTLIRSQSSSQAS